MIDNITWCLEKEKELTEKPDLDVLWMNMIFLSDISKAYKEMKNLNSKEIKKMQKAANSTLAYIINPLTHSLLKFFFEFGI